MTIVIAGAVAVALFLVVLVGVKLMDHNQDAIAESGFLTVTGTDSATFRLPGHREPNRITVEFDSSCPPLVCNPRHHDELEWEVTPADPRHHHHHRWELKIRWHVSGVRKVVWSADYDG